MEWTGYIWFLINAAALNHHDIHCLQAIYLVLSMHLYYHALSRMYASLLYNAYIMHNDCFDICVIPNSWPFGSLYTSERVTCCTLCIAIACVRLRTYLGTLIAWFMGPTWGPSGADRTQVDPPHFGPINFAIWEVYVISTCLERI